MISLLTMGAGNVKVLRKTLESFAPICNEVIYGDMLLFEEDRAILKTYQTEFNIKILPLPFNYLFVNGFSSCLNLMADNATNPMVVYMNTSEVIQVDYGMAEIVKNNPDCNAFYFNHFKENHRWFRCYNRQELRWSGLIHEELVGEYKPYYKPIFTMQDLEKDLDSPIKAKIFNDCKEMVYWNQLCRIVEDNSLLGATSGGWLQFASEQYVSMQQRMRNKGMRYDAFKEGDFGAYFFDIMTNPEFKEAKFESSLMIEFQGDKKFLL
jgi:hypothetical protein